MVNAAEEDIFVPVPLAEIKRKLETGDEKFPEYATASGALLRPSVETTMHAVLPHRVVIHVHSIATIAWAAQAGGESRVGKQLGGLRWSWIPYIHPGVPLALRIREGLALRPDMLILGNHGLVVGGDDCDSAARLLADVERRLASAPREAPAADFAVLKGLAQDFGWSVAKNDEVHLLATDEVHLSVRCCGHHVPGSLRVPGTCRACCSARRVDTKCDFPIHFALRVRAGLSAGGRRGRTYLRPVEPCLAISFWCV